MIDDQRQHWQRPFTENPDGFCHTETWLSLSEVNGLTSMPTPP